MLLSWKRKLTLKVFRLRLRLLALARCLLNISLFRKIAPGIESIWSNTKDSFAADMFERFINASSSEQK